MIACNTGRKIHDKLPFRYIPCDDRHSGMIQEILATKSGTEIKWRKCRPVPEAPRWFENVWSEYVKKLNIY